MTDRVSPADQLVVILRQRLAEHSQRTKSGRPAPSDRQGEPSHAIQALAATEGLDDRTLRRALVQNVLARQFGSGVVNDAQFQQVVERVTETLADHAHGAELLDRLVQAIRAPANR